MGLDLDAIRRKLARLQGNTGKNLLWKPKEPGTFMVRLVPIQAAIDETGLPILERQFYYNFGKTVQAPCQFGDADPVAETLAGFQAEGDNSMWKHLAPKARDFAAVIVRGEEDTGVRFWSLNKQASTRLMSFFLKDDIGDIIDVHKGFDLEVSFEKTSMENGRSWMKPTIDVSRKSSKLAKTQKQIDEWCNNIPNIDDVYAMPSYSELENMLKRWSNGFNNTDDGTAKGESQPAETTTASGTAMDKLNSAFGDLNLDSE